MGCHDATAKQLHGRTTPKSVGEFAFGLCHVDNKLDSLPQALPKCPFRNFLNRLNQLDFKGGGLIRGGVADVDA